MFRSTLCFLAFTATLAPCVSALGQQAPQIVIEKNVAMKTRDGITLRADIYRPAGEGTFPVLLHANSVQQGRRRRVWPQGPLRADTWWWCRMCAAATPPRASGTPSSTRSTTATTPWNGPPRCLTPTAKWACSADPMWARRRCSRPSAIRRIWPEFAPSSRPATTTKTGPTRAARSSSGSTSRGPRAWRRTRSTARIAADTNALVGSAVLPLNQYPVFNIAAAARWPDLTRVLAPYFLDWLAHPTYDDYWKQWSIEENYQNIQVPALTITAWYDIFQGGSLRNYLGLKAHAGNEAARNGQQLLVAIGGHSGCGRKIGAVDFGPAAAEFDENAVTLDWYDYLLHGQAERVCHRQSRSRIFVMGKNKWRDEDRLAAGAGEGDALSSCNPAARRTARRATVRCSDGCRSLSAQTSLCL